MPRALFARELTSQEREELHKGVHSSLAFRVRRSQIILMSSEEHLTARAIGERLLVSDQCVREALRAFEGEGLGCLQEKSHRKKQLKTKFSQAGLEGLGELVHQ